MILRALDHTYLTIRGRFEVIVIVIIDVVVVFAI